MNHLIRKQEIALRIGPAVDAFRVQQEVRTSYYQKLLPVLERIFDEMDLNGQVMQINRLELDLGALGWKEGGFELDAEHIYRICKQQMEDQLRNATYGSGKLELVTGTTEEHACLQWMFYMEYGVLPWALKGVSKEWLVKVIHQLAIDHVLISRLKILILASGSVLDRIVMDHEDKFLVQLAEVLSARPQPALIEDLLPGNNSATGKIQVQLKRRMAWSGLLRKLAGGQAEGETEMVQHTDVVKAQEEASKQETGMAIEELYCAHGGLILLHPFIRQLFQRLGWLVEGQFRDEACRRKAVVMLHFIATGTQEWKAYALAVPKIICGMPLADALTGDEELLTPEEEAEAIDMLQAAIAQWEIMGNASVQALREGFLEREARITVQEEHISFRMETKGIDVLLDRLPWNLSLVRFPWLTRIIYVEWR